ncbi:MAG: FG-GAP-like repeat-containing protein [Phycisphaerales bacterium]
MRSRPSGFHSPAIVALSLAACVGSASATALATDASGASEALGANPGWGARAFQTIAASEYRVIWQARSLLDDGRAALHAANRAQNLRTYFTADGIRSLPRVEANGPAGGWTFGLTLARWGRANDWHAASPTVPQVNGERVEYDRGGLTEWYANDANGLEQGFSIAQGHSSNAPLRIEMRVNGNVSPRVSEARDAVDLVTARGAVALHVDELHAFDAQGRSLPCRFDASGTRLAIEVDDRGALYPIEIDPIVKNPSWSAQGNQLQANFGYSVAGAGDVNGDGFDDVIIGAPYFDGGLADEGRAFVYYGSPAGLAAAPDWTADGGQAFGNLGLAVASAGDVNGDGFDDLIIGAPYFDAGQVNEGRALVYYGSPSGPSAAPNWSAESNQDAAYFGAAVASAGDVNGDGFADVVVGAPRYDNGSADEGRAYVFLGTSVGLSASPAWTAEPNILGAHFGAAVASAGDVNGDGFDDVIIGAPELAATQSDEGRALVYLGSASGLSPTANWTAESNQVGARFGTSVSSAGDVNGDGFDDIIVGAYLFDGGQTDEGRIVVYYGSATGPSHAPSWMAETDQAGANIGVSVASAGDVNGDGFGDIVAGAFGYDVSLPNEGRAYVFEGSATGLGTEPAWTARGNQAGAFFGTSVAGAGDVNGDGASDVIVGAPYFDGGAPDAGSAFLFLGTPPAILGDLNGDGLVNAADLAILLGAWGANGGASDLNGDGVVDAADLALLLGAWTN